MLYAAKSLAMTAIDLLSPGGTLALLIGASQVGQAKTLLSGFGIGTAAVPRSRERILLIARRNQA